MWRCRIHHIKCEYLIIFYSLTIQTYWQYEFRLCFREIFIICFLALSRYLSFLLCADYLFFTYVRGFVSITKGNMYTKHSFLLHNTDFAFVWFFSSLQEQEGVYDFLSENNSGFAFHKMFFLVLVRYKFCIISDNPYIIFFSFNSLSTNLLQYKFRVDIILHTSTWISEINIHYTINSANTKVKLNFKHGCYRELNELRKPSSDNPEILRFFRYMKAAKDGQDGEQCHIHNGCPSLQADQPRPAMLTTFNDINKLVQARILHWCTYSNTC